MEHNGKWNFKGSIFFLFWHWLLKWSKISTSSMVINSLEQTWKWNINTIKIQFSTKNSKPKLFLHLPSTLYTIERTKVSTAASNIELIFLPTKSLLEIKTRETREENKEFIYKNYYNNEWLLFIAIGINYSPHFMWAWKNEVRSCFKSLRKI